MPKVPIKTQLIDRDELARFLPAKSFRLFKFFENLQSDVASTIPDAIGQSVQGPPGGAVDDNVVVFDGTTGFSVKDSGVSIDDLAPLDSPAFTGVPTAPTALGGTSTDQIATTAFVDGETANLVEGPAIAMDDAIALFDGASGKLIQSSGVLLTTLAPLASPAFTGNPTAPTAALGDNDTTVATTAFVQAAITNLSSTAASVSAHNNGVAQSIPNNAFTKLTFGTEVYDVGAKFASSAWTPPAGRLVTMTATVAIETVANALTAISIYKNGAEYKRGDMTTSPNATTNVVQVTCMDIPNGTDVYEAYAFQNTGIARNTNGAANLTYFQGTTIQA